MKGQEFFERKLVTELLSIEELKSSSLGTWSVEEGLCWHPQHFRIVSQIYLTASNKLNINQGAEFVSDHIGEEYSPESTLSVLTVYSYL